MIEKLKNFLKEKKMTQRQLADTLGYSEETICRWLSGKQKIGKHTIEYVKAKLFL